MNVPFFLALENDWEVFVAVGVQTTIAKFLWWGVRFVKRRRLNSNSRLIGNHTWIQSSQG